MEIRILNIWHLEIDQLELKSVQHHLNDVQQLNDELKVEQNLLKQFLRQSVFKSDISEFYLPASFVKIIFEILNGNLIWIDKQVVIWRTRWK